MNKAVAVSVSGFAGGVLMRSFFDFGWGFAVLLIFLGLAVAVFYFFLKTEKLILFFGIFLISSGLGVFRYDIQEIRNMAIEDKIGSKITLVGTIIEEPEEKDSYSRLVLGMEGEIKILAIVQHYPKFYYGDKVEIFGRLEKTKKYIDSEFDWPAYLAKENIYYEMFYPNIKLVSTGDGFWLKKWLFSAKEKFIANLASIIPEPNAGYLAGLTIGAKTAMQKNLLEAFRKTGIIHVVVLSGYNITLVAGIVMKMLSALPFYFGISFGILGIFLFAIMTGASATVVRASIMAGLVLLAKATGRIYHITIALLAAGFFMVLHNPKILRFDVSFQLSFLATLALIYVSPSIEKRMTFVPKKFHLREITTATISTQIFVLPFLLYKMGIFSVVSLPVNLLVLFFVPATMLFGFLSGVAGFTSVLLGTSISGILTIPFGWAAYAFSAYELWVVNFFSKLPFSAFNISIPFWLMILIYAGYAIFLFKLSRNKKYI